MQKTRKVEKVTASERSALQIYRKQRALWRGVEEPVPSVAEGTPAMLLCRCSWEFSARKLHRKIKKSQTPDRTGVEGPAIFSLLRFLSVTFSLRHSTRLPHITSIRC